MRSSRNDIPVQEAPRSTGGRAFSVVVLLLSLAFVIVSLTAGDWVNEKVVTPVLSIFSGEKSSADQPQSILTNSPALNIPSATGARQSESIKVDAKAYYLLQGGIYSDLTNAAAASAELKQSGGGGYIIDEGDKKRVILSAYLTDTDAKTIRDRLKTEANMETYVYANNLPEFSVSVGATSDQISIIKDAFALPTYTIDNLIKISENYDKGTDQNATMSDLKAKAAAVKEKFINNVLPDDKNQSLLEVLSYISSLCDKIEKLPSDLTQKTLETSSELKYNIIEIIDSYSQFISRL